MLLMTVPAQTDKRILTMRILDKDKKKALKIKEATESCQNVSLAEASQDFASGVWKGDG